MEARGSSQLTPASVKEQTSGEGRELNARIKDDMHEAGEGKKIRGGGGSTLPI